MSRIKEKDYYSLLNISPNATSTEIKTAYHRLALQYHPDKTNDKEAEHFLLIKEAYQILSDEEKRKDYDYIQNDTTNIGINAEEIPSLYDEFEKLEDADGIYWSRPCRCGEAYEIDNEDIIEGKGKIEPILVQCVGCSLYLKVYY